MTVHATKKVLRFMSIANILAIQRLSRQNQSVTEASFSPEQELSQITQYQYRGMEIKLKVSDVRDIRRERTTSDVKRLHVIRKNYVPLVFIISPFYRGCERTTYSNFAGIMLSRGFVSAVSLVRASEWTVFTASIKRGLYTRLNGRTLRPVSSVLCRHMSNEKRSTAGGMECY